MKAILKVFRKIQVRIFLGFIFLSSGSCFAETVNNYSIVFVYIGEKLPNYLSITTAQARLFNKSAQIFLIANESSLNSHPSLVHELQSFGVQFIPCEHLNNSEQHTAFEHRFSSLNISGYWKHTTERFFYLDDLMQQYNLKDVFQVEADVMLYIDLEKCLPILHKYYPGMAAPFDNDYVASVSFTYFANGKASKDFSEFIENELRSQYIESDMVLLASYKNSRTDQEIDHLPTIPKEYLRIVPLKSERGDISSRPWKYWNHIESWDSLFDPDGFGSLLTEGVWEFNQTLFDPIYFSFQWETDSEGRKIPYLYTGRYFYNNKHGKYRVNTLHVFHKSFEGLYSLDLKTLPSRIGSKWEK